MVNLDFTDVMRTKIGRGLLGAFLEVLDEIGWFIEAQLKANLLKGKSSRYNQPLGLQQQIEVNELLGRLLDYPFEGLIQSSIRNKELVRIIRRITGLLVVIL